MTAPRVEFHLIPEAEPRARAKFACALAEAAFAEGRRVHLHCADPAEAAALDTLLWTFRDKSFVPHALADGGSAPDEPVVVGCDEPPAAPRELLINLAPSVPAWFASFEAVAEVISEDPATKAAGRERFKRYREQGCAPETRKQEPA